MTLPTWHRLMESVSFIENLGYEFSITESRVKINHNTDKSNANILDTQLDTTKQEAVFLALQEFEKIEGILL